MMTIAWAFIKTWYKEIAVVLVLLAIYAYYHHLTSTIENQAKKITDLTTANSTLTENNGKLTAAIGVTNKAVEAMSKGADQTKAGFATLDSSVKGQLNALTPKLASILNTPKPQTCPDTIKYLLDARKEYQ